MSLSTFGFALVARLRAAAQAVAASATFAGSGTVEPTSSTDHGPSFAVFGGTAERVYRL